MAIWLAMTFCWAVINVKIGKRHHWKAPVYMEHSHFYHGLSRLRNHLNRLTSHLQHFCLCQWRVGVLCHFIWHPKCPISLSPSRSLYPEFNDSTIRIFLPIAWLFALTSRSGNFGTQLLTTLLSHFLNNSIVLVKRCCGQDIGKNRQAEMFGVHSAHHFRDSCYYKGLSHCSKSSPTT